MRLEGETSIVTGGGSGIGRATALTFAREGSDIVIADIDLPSAEKVAREVESAGRRALPIKVDISEKKDIDRMVAGTLDRFGKIDILVNDAGISERVLLEDVTEEHMERTLRVNIKGTVWCCQAVVRQMSVQKRGRIVNIASSTAISGAPGFAVYSATKGGIIALTRTIAMEGAKYNIRVNAVNPGITLTVMVEKISKTSPAFAKVLRDRVKATPLRRLSRPEDIANAVLFLASGESDNITGQTITVDGGNTALVPGYEEMVCVEA